MTSSGKRLPRAELLIASGCITAAAGVYSNQWQWCVIGIIAALFYSFRAGILLLTGIVPGLLFCFLHLHHEKQNAAILPQNRIGADIICSSIDSRFSSSPGISNPKLILCRLQEINGEKLPGKAKILVRRKGSEKETFLYGDTLSGTGIFYPAGEYHFQDDEQSSFDRYLLGKGIAGVWVPESIQKTAPGRGFRKNCILLRDKLLDRCTADFSSERIRNLSGAMLFGTTGGFRGAAREPYVKTGTVHLFSISGMHVAMFSAMLALALRILNHVKLRMILILLLTVLYVFIAGSNPPALRALTVIAIWTAGRFLNAAQKGIDILALSAGVLILADPGVIHDAGAQFSFLITAVLLLASERFAEWGLRFRFMIFPDIMDPARRRKYVNAIVCAVISCILAFAAGSVVCAVNDFPVLPGSVLINLLLLPLIPLIFLLFGLKAVLGNLLPGVLPEKLFLLIDSICSASGDFIRPLSIGTPPVPEAVFFVVLLLTALSNVKHIIRDTCAALAVLLLFSWVLDIRNHPAAVLLTTSATNDLPMAVIAEPDRDLAVLVNVPDAKSAEKAVRFLKSRGIRQPDVLCFTTSRPAAAKGAWQLSAAGCTPGRIPLEQNSRALQNALEKQGMKNVVTVQENTRYSREYLKIFTKKEHCKLEYFDPGSTLRLSIDIEQQQGNTVFTIRQGGNTSIYSISRSSTREAVIHELY